jgi:hypothetical protein
MKALLRSKASVCGVFCLLVVSLVLGERVKFTLSKFYVLVGLCYKYNGPDVFIGTGIRWRADDGAVCISDFSSFSFLCVFYRDCRCGDDIV